VGARTTSRVRHGRAVLPEGHPTYICWDVYPASLLSRVVHPDARREQETECLTGRYFDDRLDRVHSKCRILRYKSCIVIEELNLSLL
jgi:hypothetical protein